MAASSQAQVTGSMVVWVMMLALGGPIRA